MPRTHLRFLFIYDKATLKRDSKDYYTSNANSYIKEITELDSEFEETVNKSKTKKIAFGGAFAYAYFIERYDLTGYNKKYVR